MKLNFWKGYALLTTVALAFVVGNTVLPADAGPSPHMSGALNKLEDALKRMGKEGGGFGGHRVKAMAATKTAIDEVKLALAFDDTRPGPAPAP